MDICTVVATNYMAHARVLASSFTRHHPGAACHVLVIDDVDAIVDEAAEPFVLVRPSDLDLDAGALDEMRASYDVVELSTALKPWLLRHMLRRGADVAYLDPDIRIESPMPELQHALRTHPIVLTPHLTAPLPRDGRRPSETDILLAGVYNLGFIGLAGGPDAEAMLSWWCERLRRDCRVDIEHGLFVDQRWMDFVPGLHERLHILRLPNYNLAYWNLPTRVLTNGGDQLSVDGEPLRFFHFSGYNPRAPHELSRHQNRFALTSDPLLRALCDGYRRDLLHAGFDAAALRPYAYDSLPGGVPIDPVMRRLHRVAVESGELTEPVFSERGAVDFTHWLNEPQGVESDLTRYLSALWEGRADLRSAFPDVHGGDRLAYLAWSAADAERSIPAPLRPAPPHPALPAAARSVAPGPPRPFGANVTGFLRSELGIGEVARQVISALDAAAVPVAPIALATAGSRQGHDFAAITGPGPFATDIVCVNADGLLGLGPEHLVGDYTIGFWWWELDAFPEALQASFALVDEVWVGSRFVAEALADAPVPVVHVPVAMEFATPEPLRAGELGWPDAFTVLFSWDYHSVFARKNPLAAIEAYCRAFSPGDGAALVLKSINHQHHPAEHEQLRAAAAERPDIVVIDDYVAAADKNRMVAGCDVYLSLHRSEGLGLTMLEAMHQGIPVVATGYSGNADFLNRSTGFPVDYVLVPVGAGNAPYPPDARWAEPDIGHAARQLRHVFEHPEQARRIAARGRAWVQRRYSPLAVGRVMERRLREVEQLQAKPAEPPAPSDDTALTALLQWRGRPRFPSRFGLPGAALRRLVLRLARPYTTYQADVNDALRASLAHAEQRTRAADLQAEQRLAELHATLLTELRRRSA